MSENSFNSEEFSQKDFIESPETEIRSEKETIIESEVFNEEKALEKYQKENNEVQEKIESLTTQKETLKQNLEDVRKELYGNDVPLNLENPSLESLSHELQNLTQEKIKVSANYPGDWTLLLRDRALDQITKEKFIQVRQDVMPQMKQGEMPVSDGLSFEKPESYASYYQKQIDEYDSNVEKIFDRTHISSAEDNSRRPHNVGVGAYGKEGTIFTDGISKDRPLTPREKNIIEAHEKGHGLRNFITDDRYDFRHSIDINVLKEDEIETGTRTQGYFMKVEEIAERMAQLKNYFGMNAREEFSKDHLDYAKSHYREDTGLDNNMTVFFKAITSNVEKKFIETINKYPL